MEKLKQDFQKLQDLQKKKHDAYLAAKVKANKSKTCLELRLLLLYLDFFKGLYTKKCPGSLSLAVLLAAFCLSPTLAPPVSSAALVL